LYVLLFIYAVFTGQDSRRIRARRDPDAKLGWLQFRKRTTLTFTLATVFLLYLTYVTVAGLCWGSEPSSRFTQVYDLLTVPKNSDSDSTCTILALVLFLVHVTHRLYQCLRISIFSRSHVTGPLRMLKDHVYYILAGLSLVSSGPALVSQTGPALVSQTVCVSLSSLKWFHIASVLLFYFSSKTQQDTHTYLAKLRRNKSGHIVTTDYKQPKDSWFAILNLSCPHYLAEILIYISIWITLGCSADLSSLLSPWSSVVLYVIANQLYRAHDVHSFYKVKFEDYPVERRIILPYIF